MEDGDGENSFPEHALWRELQPNQDFKEMRYSGMHVSMKSELNETVTVNTLEV